MKKKELITFLGGIFLVLTLVAPIAAKETLWRMNTWQPGTKMEVAYMQMAVDEIYKLSNGQLKIEIYPAFALGHNSNTWLRDMKNGVIDISCVYPGLTAGEEPSLSILEMPNIWKTREQNILAMDSLFNFKKRVYKDVWGSELIASGTIMDTDYEIFTKGKLIKGLDDLKGLKIRTPGGRYRELYTLIGAAPQMIPQPELYMSMKTGVIDGYRTGSSVVYAMNLYEVSKYGLIAGPTETLQQDIVVSHKVWNALPSDLQEIVRKVWDKWAAAVKGRTIHGIDDAYWRTKNIEKGMVYNKMSEEELIKFRENAMKILLDWVKKTGGRTIEAWELIKPIIIPPTQPGKPEQLFTK
jgi:TRAP-type C4-dicarboxylate transport system substrate-binding protein